MVVVILKKVRGITVQIMVSEDTEKAAERWNESNISWRKINVEATLVKRRFQLNRGRCYKVIFDGELFH